MNIKKGDQVRDATYFKDCRLIMKKLLYAAIDSEFACYNKSPSSCFDLI